MIVIDPQDVMSQLKFPVIDSHGDIEQKLTLAVKACAVLTDPLVSLLRNSGIKANAIETLNLAKDWLVRNAQTFDKASLDPTDLLFLEGVLEGDPYKVWTFNIEQLAQALVQRNYTQGWGDYRHPIFHLEHPYVSSEDGSKGELRWTPLKSEQDWAQFVRAVIARASSAPDHAGANSYVDVLVEILAKTYPVLGSYRGNGIYHAACRTKRMAVPLWRDNINTAAARLKRELGRRT